MKRGSQRRSPQAGMTLIETMIALAVLFIVAAGLMGLAAVAIVSTENQGHLAARTAEYAQDKMEQLVSLKFEDGDGPLLNDGSDTITVTPTLNCVQFLVNSDCSTGGSGLAIGGTADPDCGDAGHPACVNLYVDYLDLDGNPLGGGLNPPNDWFYKRVWQISAPVGTNNLKQITVACKTRSIIGPGRAGKEPRAVLTMFKSWPF